MFSLYLRIVYHRESFSGEKAFAEEMLETFSVKSFSVNSKDCTSCSNYCYKVIALYCAKKKFSISLIYGTFLELIMFRKWQRSFSCVFCKHRITESKII